MKETENRDTKEARFGELLAHRKTIFLICLGYSKNYEEAEELTQDIYVRIWEKMDTSTVEGTGMGWLISVARNRCIDHIRKLKIRNLFTAGRTGPHPPKIEENTPESESLREDDRTRLKKCIAGLPEKLRSVFVLKEYSGLKGNEISEALGIRAGTVHSRLNRARKQIKSEMEVHNG